MCFLREILGGWGRIVGVQSPEQSVGMFENNVKENRLLYGTGDLGEPLIGRNRISRYCNITDWCPA